jgi:hypothetical protein
VGAGRPYNRAAPDNNENNMLLQSVAAAAALIAAAMPALSTEGGGTSKALGVDTVLAGMMPAPGLRLTTFLAGYRTDATLDGAGSPRTGLSNFDLDVKAVTLRFQYVWPGAHLFGADIETRFGATAWLDSSVSFDVRTPTGASVHRSDSVTSGGDMLVGPAMLGWHGERLHQTLGVQFYLPAAAFSASRLANPGRGYYSVGPIYALTWFPVDPLEVSVSSNFLFNRENPDTRYTSGRELSIDYGLGYDFAREWQVGASGYAYRQVTDDRVNGEAVAGGNRGQAFATGPFVRYHPGRNWGITLKWQREFKVENRTRGDRLVLQMAASLF